LKSGSPHWTISATGSSGKQLEDASPDAGAFGLISVTLSLHRVLKVD
jgi:hypothetical protein